MEETLLPLAHGSVMLHNQEVELTLMPIDRCRAEGQADEEVKGKSGSELLFVKCETSRQVITSGMSWEQCKK